MMLMLFVALATQPAVPAPMFSGSVDPHLTTDQVVAMFRRCMALQVTPLALSAIKEEAVADATAETCATMVGLLSSDASDALTTRMCEVRDEARRTFPAHVRWRRDLIRQDASAGAKDKK